MRLVIAATMVVSSSFFCGCTGEKAAPEVAQNTPPAAADPPVVTISEEGRERQRADAEAQQNRVRSGQLPKRDLGLPFHQRQDLETRAQSGPIDSASYPDRALTAREYGEGYLEFITVGVRHFSTNESIPEPRRSEVASRMMEIYERSIVWSDRVDYFEFREDVERWAADEELAGDPLVQFCIAKVCNGNGHNLKALESWKSAIYGFRKTDYPALCMVHAYELRWKIGLIDTFKGGSVSTDRPDATYYVNSMAYWLKYDCQITPQQLRYVWATIEEMQRMFNAVEQSRHIENFIGFDEENNLLEGWLRNMVKANHFYQQAWSSRGTGFASEVTAEGWEGFRNNLELATGFYERAHEECEVFPEAATQLFNIAASSSLVDDKQGWRAKMIEIAPDDFTVRNKVVRDLFPQWNGSYQQLIDFGMECANEQAYDTAVPYILLHCYDVIVNLNDLGDPDARERIYHDQEVLEKMIEACRGMANDPTPKFQGFSRMPPNWFRSVEAVLLTRIDKHGEAEDLLEELGEDFMPDAVKFFPNMPNGGYLKARAYAYNSEFTSEAMSAEIFHFSPLDEDKLEDIPVAIERLDHIIEENSNVTGGRFFRTLRELVRAEFKYLEGKTVPVRFMDQLMNMKIEGDASAPVRVSDSSVDIPVGPLRCILRPYYRLEGPKTIEVDVEFLDVDGGAVAEVSPGMWPGQQVYPGFASVVIDHHNGQAAVWYRSDNGREPWFNIGKTDGRYHVRVNADNGYLELYINDRFVCRVSSENIEVNELIGVGAFGFRKHSGTIRLSNLTVKSWEKGAPPIADPQALVDYYRELSNESPDDAMAKHMLGLAYYGTEDLVNAERQFILAMECGVDPLEAAPFLGEIYERQGDSERAMEQYRIVFEAMKDDRWTGFVSMMREREHPQLFGPEQKATGRYLWHFLFDSGASLEDKQLAAAECGPIGGVNVEWMNLVLGAQIDYLTGQYGAATRNLIAARRTCPASFADELIRFNEAIDNDEPFDRSVESPPGYMNDPIMPFPTLQDYLHEVWLENF